MTYSITAHTRRQAEKLGVEVRPSTTKGKKIDVLKDGKKIAAVGALGYGDYTTFLQQDKAMAERRREAYKKRHQKDRIVRGSPGYYADKLLW